MLHLPITFPAARILLFLADMYFLQDCTALPTLTFVHLIYYCMGQYYKSSSAKILNLILKDHSSKSSVLNILLMTDFVKKKY
jgi:ABC-type arginine/histidine transport system permease subunit